MTDIGIIVERPRVATRGDVITTALASSMSGSTVDVAAEKRSVHAAEELGVPPFGPRPCKVQDPSEIAVSGLGGPAQNPPADLGGNGRTLKGSGEAAGLRFGVQAGRGRWCHANPDRCLRGALVGRRPDRQILAARPARREEQGGRSTDQQALFS